MVSKAEIERRVKAVKKFRKKGKKNGEIARKMRVGYQTIANDVHKLICRGEIAKQKPGGRKGFGAIIWKKRKKTVLALRLANVSNKEICRITGIPPKSLVVIVSQLLNEGKIRRQYHRKICLNGKK